MAINNLVKKLSVCAACIVAISTVSALPASAEETRITVGGTGYHMWDRERVLPHLAKWLGYTGTWNVGSGMTPNTTPIVVEYPATVLFPPSGDSVEIGAENTATMVKAVDGPVVVAGISQGAVVANRAAAKLENDPNPPPADAVEFYTYGDPDYGVFPKYFPPNLHVPFLDFTLVPVEETRYDKTVVIGEYDGFGDPPDRPWNPLAMANAVMGVLLIHTSVSFTEAEDVEVLSSTTNSKGGTTTVVLAPTKELPLTRPLRRAVPDRVVDRVDDVLRPVIDRAYTRHDEPGDTRPYVSGGRIVRPDGVKLLPRRHRDN